MNRRQAPFVIMLEYMECNGDINQPLPGSRGRRISADNHRKWLELAELLNTSAGTTRTLEKWRKAWRDFKNNTRKKLRRIKQRDGNGSFTQTEIRLLKLLKVWGLKRRVNTVQYSRKKNEIIESKEAKPKPCQEMVSPPPEYVCAVYESTSHRRKSNSSIESNSTSNHTSGKRKKPLNDKIIDVTDRYFEFEREREALAHEREMARIRQNEQVIDIFGRMVNVLETLTPRIERYLNRNKNKDR